MDLTLQDPAHFLEESARIVLGGAAGGVMSNAVMNQNSIIGNWISSVLLIIMFGAVLYLIELSPKFRRFFQKQKNTQPGRTRYDWGERPAS